MISIFMYSLVYSQGVCNYSESSFEDDVSNSVEFNAFNCVDTVTNGFVTQAELSVVNIGSFCPSWYYFDLAINGSTVDEGLCSINSVDLSSYGVNLNTLSSVKVTSVDADGVSDPITLNVNLDLTYIVTTCPPPTFVTATNVNPTSAEINWQSNGTEALWNLELVNLTLGEIPTGISTTSGISADSFNLSGLLPENQYAVYVQADCGPFNDDPLSPWSLPAILSTPPSCFPLGPVFMDLITDSSVVLLWDQAGSENLWDVELINTTIGDTFTFIPNHSGLNTNSPLFTGLIPENDYQFRVRADCGVIDGESVWTIPYSFSTLPICVPPVEMELVSFSYAEVKINWVPQDDEGEWYVEIVNVTGGETPTGTFDDSSAVSSYTAMGLSAVTEYSFYIAANCGAEDGVSDWVGPLTVTTDCAPVLGPYSYDVEGHPITTSSDIQDCWRSDPTGTSSEYRWNVDGGGSTPSNDTGPSGAFGGVNYFYVEATGGSEGDVASLYSQYVDLSGLSEPGLSFMYHMYGEDMGALSIDINDNGVWIMDAYSISGEQQSSEAESWIEANVNLASYVNNVQIRFRATRADGFTGDISLDNISIDEGIGCYAPSSLIVDTLLPTSAFVTWDDNNTITPLAGWTIEYGAGGFVTGSGDEFPTVDPFFLIDNLTPGETYDFYVRAECTPGVDISEWSQAGTFYTPCAAFDVPYFYDVETQIITTNSDLFVNCWTATPASGYGWEVEDGPTGSSDTGPNGAFSGDKYYFTEATFGLPGDEAELITPELDLSSLTIPILQFRYHMYGSEMGSLHVDIFNNVWNNDEFVLNGEQQVTASDPWLNASVDLSAYTGVVKVRFRGQRGEGFHGDMSLDDIQVKEQPTCFPPTVIIDSISTSSINFTIDSTGTFGDQWMIELVNLTLGEVPTGIPTDTLTSILAALNDLQDATNYELFLFTDCGVEESGQTSILFQTKCALIGDFVKDWEELSTISGGNDTAICWSYLVESVAATARIYVSSSSGSLAHSPTNFIRMFNQSDLDPELLLISPELLDINTETHLFTFWARSLFDTSPFEVGTIGDIGDPSTFTPMFSGSVTDVYDSIAVPFLSYSGLDTRIAIKFNPLTTFDYLFVDDVRWEAGPSCALPVNFTALDFTDAEVTLDWLNVSPDVSWGVELINVSQGQSFTNIATDTTFTHPFTITGLSENSIYSMQLTNDCDTFWTSDLTIVTPWASDVGVSSILSPDPNGCNLGDSTQIVVEITNYGGQPKAGIPIQLSFDGLNYNSVGSYLDTLFPGGTTEFTLDGFYDFSSAVDSNFFVRSVLSDDSLGSNDLTASTVSNLGDQLINVTVNTGGFADEVYWKLRDSLNNIYVFEQPEGYTNNSSFHHDVCVLTDNWYVMEAYDSFGDGWNGGTYEITKCGGIIMANNNGDEVTNGGGGSNPNDLEVEEAFFVEPCPDNDLALLSFDSIFSACGLGVEVPYVDVMNFGNLDVPSLGATLQYNYGGGWIDFWDFSGGLSSQSDTLFQMPSIDMSIAGQYTLQVQILFTSDEDATSNLLEETIVSVPNLTEDSASFELDFEGWTSHVSTGVNNSWQWGTPTTLVAGNGNDGKVWATNLSGDAALNEESYLLSPCYDFSSYTEMVELSYDFVREGAFHTFRLEYELNESGAWTLLELLPDNINEWTTQINLLNLAGENNVRFRWFYDSSFNNPVEGFAFDNWELSEHELYTDASLSFLAVNGDTVSDPVAFDPDVLFYNYINPYGTTLWVVTAAVNAPFFTSMVIDEPLSLPGIATVTVTAEDTSVVNIYTINLSETPPSTDATLSEITVSNTTLAGFHPDTLCYDVVFPAGSTFIPSLFALVSDPNATLQISNTNIPGTATILVTAEDGVTTRTYCLNYIQSVLSTDATLSDITIDGLSLVGFDPDTVDYTIVLDDTVTVVPFVGYTTTDVNATAVLVLPGSLPGMATITVTAEDGFSMLLYTVMIELEPSTNADLLDLAVDGTTIAGFNASITSYDVELSFGSAIPTVVGLAEDPNATVDVSVPAGVPGTTEVTVTAEDGVTIKTYFVNWTYGVASTNADLATLSSSKGSLAPDFHPDSLFYTNCIGDQQLDIATLTFTLADTTSSWEYVSTPGSPYEDYVIQVTAQDGITVKIYTVDLNECWPIGIEELKLEQLIVSPNPSRGVFKITLPIIINNVNYLIVDQLGKVLFEGRVENPGYEFDLDFSALAIGNYSLQISVGEVNVVKKITISR